MADLIIKPEPTSGNNWVGESKNSHPTQNEIDTEVIRLQAEYDSQRNTPENVKQNMMP